jgi:hypothetical protein
MATNQLLVEMRMQGIFIHGSKTFPYSTSSGSDNFQNYQNSDSQNSRSDKNHQNHRSWVLGIRLLAVLKVIITKTGAIRGGLIICFMKFTCMFFYWDIHVCMHTLLSSTMAALQFLVEICMQVTYAYICIYIYIYIYVYIHIHICTCKFWL